MQTEIMKKPIHCQSLWRAVRSHTKSLLTNIETSELPTKPQKEPEQTQKYVNVMNQPKEF